MKLVKYNIKGEQDGFLEVDDALFGESPNMVTVYELLNSEAANKRQGTHSTKGRSEVDRTKAKPFRQKGTGRARAGSASSPLWRGGGVVFGPKPRSYKNKLPQKIRKNAIRSILCHKMKENQIAVLEDLRCDSGKTKDMAAFLANVQGRKKTILLEKGDNTMLKRGLRNLKEVSFLSEDRLEGTTLYGADIILIKQTSLDTLKQALN